MSSINQIVDMSCWASWVGKEGRGGGREEGIREDKGRLYTFAGWSWEWSDDTPNSV